MLVSTPEISSAEIPDGSQFTMVHRRDGGVSGIAESEILTSDKVSQGIVSLTTHMISWSGF